MLNLYNDSDTKEDVIAGRLMVVDKPQGVSSFFEVNRVRKHLCRKYGLKKLKVGHAGTLDPFATGVLVLCIGRYTKRVSEIQVFRKTYLASLVLGKTTVSLDTESEITVDNDFISPDGDTIDQTLQSFIGTSQQMPPDYSAKKVGGRRAYDLARNNIAFELTPSTVTIYDMRLIDYDGVDTVIFEVDCGKGTYVRSLARDVARSLGTVGYLHSLRRLRVGDYSVKR